MSDSTEDTIISSSCEIGTSGDLLPLRAALMQLENAVQAPEAPGMFSPGRYVVTIAKAPT